MKLVGPNPTGRGGSKDLRDAETRLLWVGGELHVDLANLPRECLIARQLFFRGTNYRQEIMDEAKWTHIGELCR